MIYGDQDISSALASGTLIIEPPPARGDISPSSVDLRLHNTFTVFDDGVPEGVDIAVMVGVADSERVVRQFGSAVHIDGGGYLELRPGQFVLAYTRERVELPRNLAARVEGKSSLARLGLSIHQSAPTIHASFAGNIRLEIANVGHFVCRLMPGIPVCQLIIEELKNPASEIQQSRFQNQTPF